MELKLNSIMHTMHRNAEMPCRNARDCVVYFGNTCAHNRRKCTHCSMFVRLSNTKLLLCVFLCFIRVLNVGACVLSPSLVKHQQNNTCYVIFDYYEISTISLLLQQHNYMSTGCLYPVVFLRFSAF